MSERGAACLPWSRLRRPRPWLDAGCIQLQAGAGTASTYGWIPLTRRVSRETSGPDSTHVVESLTLSAVVGLEFALASVDAYMLGTGRSVCISQGAGGGAP